MRFSFFISQISLFLALSATSLVFADSNSTQTDEETITKIAGDILDKSFRLRDDLTVTLDGSSDAQEITRQSKTTNIVLFLDKQNWRAHRELPFSHSFKEILKENDNFFSATPTNRLINWHEPFRKDFWLEIVITPVQFAQQWSFIDSSSDLDDLMDKLKKSGNILKNTDGDQMELKTTTEGFQIISSGFILHDSKTKIHLQNVWEVTQVGKLQKTDLQNSVLRSL